MSTIHQQMHQAFDLFKSGVANAEHDLVRMSLTAIADCMAEALAAREFGLIYSTNKDLTDFCHTTSLVEKASMGHLPEATFELIAEQVAFPTHVSTQSVTRKCKPQILIPVVKNLMAFHPNEHHTYTAMIGQMTKDNQQVARAMLFEQMLHQRLSCKRSDYKKSVFEGIYVNTPETWGDPINEALSQPMLDMVLKQRQAVLQHARRDMKDLWSSGVGMMAEYACPLPFNVVQQLYDHGLTELPSILSPSLLGTKHTPGQFILAERMDVTIEREWVEETLRTGDKRHYDIAALYYAMKSDTVSSKELAGFLVSDAPSNTQVKKAALIPLLENIVTVLQALYTEQEDPEPLVHEKSKVVLKWLTRLRQDISPIRAQILKIKHFPKDLIEAHPSFIEEKFAGDMGL